MFHNFFISPPPINFDQRSPRPQPFNWHSVLHEGKRSRDWSNKEGAACTYSAHAKLQAFWSPTDVTAWAKCNWISDFERGYYTFSDAYATRTKGGERACHFIALCDLSWRAMRADVGLEADWNQVKFTPATRPWWYKALKTFIFTLLGSRLLTAGHT